MNVKVEVFSAPGCNSCGQARQVLKSLAEEMGSGHFEWREVNVLDELDYAVEMGVFATPAIAINGELIFTGQTSEDKLRKALQDLLPGKQV